MVEPAGDGLLEEVVGEAGPGLVDQDGGARHCQDSQPTAGLTKVDESSSGNSLLLKSGVNVEIMLKSGVSSSQHVQTCLAAFLPLLGCLMMMFGRFYPQQSLSLLQNYQSDPKVLVTTIECISRVTIRLLGETWAGRLDALLGDMDLHYFQVHSTKLNLFSKL